ncbi:hypothetical protein FGU65_13740 [Methanoculleus sp. FWC-SCC1]|uniref:Uncharacterized protein n=1 Tax=Methanoculleus frigidifontis TaxID=2584085 RepID=A0ABT8MDA6_9EURY|nr:hypothetical protein [Methanoculleus sp. FWC-SCC1]MDN7025932.1 hypothetical protein [Methanoculleus sp. FWC-SCC1]
MTLKGMNERGVSEAIGFVLILGLMITSIAMVTLYGYPVLLKEQSNTDVRNMERAMIVIQNDIKNLCYKSVPYEETALQVSGGSLEVVDAGAALSSFNITTSEGFSTGDISLGKFRYFSDRGSAVIALENGAVLTRQDGQQGSAILAEPRWFFDDSTDTLVVYTINISASEPLSTMGMSTVRMSLTSPTTVMNTSFGASMGVNVIYAPDTDDDYSTGWKNYLNGTLDMAETAANTYTLTGVEKLIVKSYTVTVHSV